MARWKDGLAGLAALLLLLVLRTLNFGTAFEGGVPQIRPLDDLYHLKRIAYSAAEFPKVLDFDEDRGVRGSYCPWPPLYDLTAGGAARLAGARTIPEVLDFAVWIPPLTTALFFAVFSFLLWRRWPWLVLVTVAAFGLAPAAMIDGWIGSIDHHFLEPLLVLAILGASLEVLGSEEDSELRPGLLYGVAMTVAMFVQPALILACGGAFAVTYMGRKARATTIAFALPAILITAYRLTRSADVPNNSWFLGWPHAAMFLGAAVAAGVAWKLPSASILRRQAAGLVAGVVAALLFPGTLQGISNGARFLGGDAWLARISEFRPIWKLSGWPLQSYLLALVPGGVFAAVLLLRALRKRDLRLAAVGGAAAMYLGLAVSSIRFTTIAVAMLALAAGMLADVWMRDGRRRMAMLVVVVMLVTGVVNATQFIRAGAPHPFAAMTEAMRVAGFLRTHNPRHERVLAPWSWGHAIDVIGNSPVIVDNFGTSQDAAAFREAHEMLLTTDEEQLAAYCRRTGTRFVVLEKPPIGIVDAALVIGLPFEDFVGDQVLTPRTLSSWYWNAWGQFPRPTAHFAPAFATRGGAVRVWRLRDVSVQPASH